MKNVVNVVKLNKIMKTRLTFGKPEYSYASEGRHTACRLPYSFRIPKHIINSIAYLPGMKKHLMPKHDIDGFIDEPDTEFYTVECVSISCANKHKDDNLDIKKGEYIAYLKAKSSAYKRYINFLHDIKLLVEKHIIKTLNTTIESTTDTKSNTDSQLLKCKMK